MIHNKKILTGLDQTQYEHPFDRKALNALENTPGLTVAGKYITKQTIERIYTVQYTGSNLKVIEKNYPDIYEYLDYACKILDLDRKPELYIQWGYGINAFTVGAENPIVVLNSGKMGCAGNSEIKERHSSHNYILAEFEIKEEHLEEEQCIFNPVNKVLEEGEEDDIENRERRECEIQINGEVIPFDSYYQFPKVGIYKIKYTFNSPITDASSLFFYCTCLSKVDLSNFQGQNLKTMRHMFTDCQLLKSVNFSNLDLQNVIDMSVLLSGSYNLKIVNLNFKNKKVENIAGLFSNCASLESVNLSKLNTENIIDMSDLFSFCRNLKNVDLSSFNTKNVIYMNNMFYECGSLENIKLSNFNTSNVTNMNNMFSYCTSLKEIDLSNFNTQNVEDMEFMFSSCESLTRVNLSNFNTSKAKTNAMFYQCTKLEREGIIAKERKIFQQYEKDTTEE